MQMQGMQQRPQMMNYGAANPMYSRGMPGMPGMVRSTVSVTTPIIFLFIDE